MKGRRVYPDNRGSLHMAEGDYGKDAEGVWHVRPPGCSMGPLDGHEVTEHEDGTITVAPSIRSEWGEKPYFHGYLERGVWRNC